MAYLNWCHQKKDWDLRTLESFFHGEVVEVAVAVKPENEPAVFENTELTSAWPGATELWQSLLEEEQLPSEILGRTCDLPDGLSKRRSL